MIVRAADGFGEGTLGDFEATLRQVERVLGDFSNREPEEHDGPGGRPTGLLNVLEMLVRAHDEIDRVGRGLHELRVELQQTAEGLRRKASGGDVHVALHRADGELAQAEQRLGALATLFDLREVGLSELADSLAGQKGIDTARP